jgi:hypothetical protein
MLKIEHYGKIVLASGVEGAVFGVKRDVMPRTHIGKIVEHKPDHFIFIQEGNVEQSFLEAVDKEVESMNKKAQTATKTRNLMCIMMNYEGKVLTSEVRATLLNEILEAI